MRAGEMGFTTAEVGDLVVEGARVSDPAVRVELYDTTLRDGAQQADLSYTVEDRLRILHKLDQVGFPYIEGGWPGANPRDTEFFRLATKEPLEHAQLTAFGMTRRAGERTEDSQVLRDLLDAGTEVVCLVGKSWDLHVTEALRTDLDEGVAMVRDSVAFLRAQGRRVFFDAEHFFDGYESDPVFAMAVLGAAEEAGAERLVLCDTNGGMLPVDVARIVTRGQGTGERRRSGSTCTTTRAARSRTRSSRSTPVCSRCRGRSTATASGPATPTSCRSRPTSCSRWA